LSASRAEKYSNKSDNPYTVSENPDIDTPNGLVYSDVIKGAKEMAASQWLTNEKKDILLRIAEVELASPASTLTKARQTLSFVDGSHQPGRWEYYVLIQTLKKNLGEPNIFKVVDTMRSVCLAISMLFELLVVFLPYHLEDFENGNVIVKWMEVKQPEFRLISLTISTMLKGGEKGKLVKRMIATHNMLARPFAAVAEGIAMKMLSYEESSVIHVGGDRKKVKMTKLLQPISTASVNGHYAVISGDNTKWNECLNAAVMGTVLLSAFTQPHVGHEWAENGSWIMAIQIISVAYSFFANKLVLTGKGIAARSAEKKHSFYVPPTIVQNLTEEFRQIWNDLRPEQFVSIPYPNAKNYPLAYRLVSGMLMGMFNAGSTYYALQISRVAIAEIMGRFEGRVKADIRQSSDDFEMVIYVESDYPGWEREMMLSIDHIRLVLKFAGINWSPEKSIFGVDSPVGELTSSYHTTRHFGNVSTEIPGMVPQGNNPYTDIGLFTNFLRGCLAKNALEHGTADFCLDLFLKHYTRFYELGKGSITHELNLAVQEKFGCINCLHANGGPRVYSVSSLSFPELALRTANLPIDGSRTVALPKATPAYVNCVMSPINPFSSDKETIDMYVQNKRPTIEEDNMPNCIFKTEVRKNETTSTRGAMLAVEAEAMKIVAQITAADATLSLSTPQGQETVFDLTKASMIHKLNLARPSQLSEVQRLERTYRETLEHESIPEGYMIEDVPLELCDSDDEEGKDNLVSRQLDVIMEE
jgi:hypothetical protein